MDCARNGYRPGGPARAIQCGLRLLPTGRYRRSVRFARTFPAEPWIREGKLVETRSRFGGSSTASPLSAATRSARETRMLTEAYAQYVVIEVAVSGLPV